MPINKIVTSIKIFVSGIVAGLFAGIALRTGISIEKTDWMLMGFSKFCNYTIEGVREDCNNVLIILGIIVGLLTLYTIWKEISRLKSIKLGKIRIPGFIFGFIIYSIGVSIGTTFILKI